MLGLGPLSGTASSALPVAAKLSTQPLHNGIAPTWASDWGQDRKFGPWCSIRVKTAVQKLRWIPPGVFWMGSPRSEKGRWGDEGPQRLITIQPGFWIFDTPCTQALWEAVMGENPSHFQGADRPVESVSWNQCQDFMDRLNATIDGLRLSLPSGAQWEYACRAGTESSRYHKKLDEIAWYYLNSQGETHAVGGKTANSWGLYDMLGNVMEWCDDKLATAYVDNAQAAKSASDFRVIRGGSWNDVARYVRAAHRYCLEPSFRNGTLGFRCAEFRAGL